MRGKEKCAILKAIRIRLAEVNNIEYTPHPCNNTRDCIGTCNQCDNESLWLLHTLKMKEKEGFPITYSLNSINKENKKKIKRQQ